MSDPTISFLVGYVIGLIVCLVSEYLAKKTYLFIDHYLGDDEEVKHGS